MASFGALPRLQLASFGAGRWVEFLEGGSAQRAQPTLQSWLCSVPREFGFVWRFAQLANGFVWRFAQLASGFVRRRGDGLSWFRGLPILSMGSFGA
jgi:hypothetical protein